MGLDGQVSPVAGDVTRPACGVSVDQRLSDVREVWHCAALTSFDASHREQVFQVNLGGTRETLALAALLPRLERFVYVSTAYVCGTMSGIVPEDSVSPSCFRNAYEESKAAGEAVVRRSSLPWDIYRPSILMDGDADDRAHRMVFGAALTMYRGVVAKARRAGLSVKDVRERVRTTPRGEAWMDIGARIPAVHSATHNIIALDDCVEVMLRLREATRPAHQTYNIVSPVPVSTADLFAAIQEALRIRGIVFDTSITVQALMSSQNPAERAIARLGSVYFPYVCHPEPHWERENVRAIVPDDTRQVVTTEYLRRAVEAMYSQYLQQNPLQTAISIGLNENREPGRSNARAPL